MDIIHHPEENQSVKTSAPSRVYTFRIPRPNWQVTALVLIALIAAFQTFQLTRLKGTVTTAATTSNNATSSTAQASGSSSGLQSQVGGC